MGKPFKNFTLTRNQVDLVSTAGVTLVVVCGSMVLVGYGVGVYSSNPGAWASALVWSFASLVLGFAVGFLFGIPRVLQQDPKGTSESPGKAQDYQMRVNTNLEQISDWLTKIIVGVGLVQLQSIPAFLKKVGTFAAESFYVHEGLASPAASFGVGLISLFFAEGFLGGYTLTRLFLAGAFGRADKDALGTGSIAAPKSMDPNYTPSPGGRKVLSTLWLHQERAQKDKRWTFTVLPASPDYSDFKSAVEELFHHRLIGITPEGQIMLSDEGFDFLDKRNEEYSLNSDVYRFS